jgi:hypothetical protein
VWRTRVDTEIGKAQARSNRLVQGIDEGLADTFSLAVTQDLGGIPRAFAQAKGLFAAEADRRDLEGDFADAATYDNLRDLTLDAKFLSDDCRFSTGADNFEDAGFNFYCLGTVVARTMWEGSDRDLAILRDDTLPAIIRAYASVGARIADDPLFDMHYFLQPLVEELPAERQAAMCAAIEERFASLVNPPEGESLVPACP